MVQATGPSTDVSLYMVMRKVPHDPAYANQFGISIAQDGLDGPGFAGSEEQVIDFGGRNQGREMKKVRQHLGLDSIQEAAGTITSFFCRAEGKQRVETTNRSTIVHLSGQIWTKSSADWLIRYKHVITIAVQYFRHTHLHHLSSPPFLQPRPHHPGFHQQRTPSASKQHLPSLPLLIEASVL